MSEKIFVDIKEHPIGCTVVFDISTNLGNLQNVLSSICKNINNEFENAKEEADITITVYQSTLSSKKNLDYEEENVLDELEKSTGINREIIRIVRRAEEKYLDEIICELGDD